MKALMPRWRRKDIIASLAMYLTFAYGAIEWEMIDIIVAKKDVKVQSPYKLMAAETVQLLSNSCNCNPRKHD